MRSRLRCYLLPALAFLAAGFPASVGAQGLALVPGDLRMEARDDGGYNLFVRKRPEVGSILLTESTKDPAMKADNFAYRSPEFNEVNGREKRMLNGKALPPASKLFSLISSTPLPDPAFGQAFRILIPPVLIYGYPWSRSGSVAVGKGTFINIRSFAKAYADYKGAFLDNPYQIAISAKPVPPPVPVPPPSEPKPAAVVPPPEPPQKESPPPPADDRTSAKIGDAIDGDPGKSLDLVVCLDTTESMVPYIDDIKKNLGPIIRQRVAGFKSFRIGLVLYKDYWPDEYITRKFPFTSDIAVFERNLKSISVYGGMDIPEAVYEALLAAATEFDWQADRRQMVLVGDAPPHPLARGKVGFDDVAREAGTRHIELDTIVEPALLPPPIPDHGEFEHAVRRFALLSANGAAPRLVTYVDAIEPQRSLLLRSIETQLPGAQALGMTVNATTGGAAVQDAAAIKTAAASGASHLLIVRTETLGADKAGAPTAMSETVSRLLDVSTGKEIERDIVWRVLSLSGDGSKFEAEFVNGVRVK